MLDPGCCVIPAAIGDPWFSADRDCMHVAAPRVYEYPHCFLTERLSFAAPSGETVTHQHGHVVLYLGSNIDGFCDLFSEMGVIPGHNSWSRNSGQQGAAKRSKQQQQPQQPQPLLNTNGQLGGNGMVTNGNGGLIGGMVSVGRGGDGRHGQGGAAAAAAAAGAAAAAAAAAKGICSSSRHAPHNLRSTSTTAGRAQMQEPPVRHMHPLICFLPAPPPACRHQRASPTPFPTTAGLRA
ncbi:MAG: hypothetical protein WDW38_010069 [Sanguina aurantia]